MYSPHTSGKSTLLSMGSPQTRMSGFQRTEFDLSSDTQAFSRPVGLDSIHFETEQGGNYSQSPAYILPNAQSGMVDYEASASSWSPKIWEPVLNVNRSSNGGTNIYPETDTNGSMNQTPYSYMLPSQGMTSNEIAQTTATTMNMVSVSDIPCSDRILPTPTSRSQQISNNTSASSASASVSAMNLFADGVPGLSVPSDFKTSYWNQNQNQRCMDQHQHQHQRTHTVPSNAPFPSPTQSSKCSNTNNDTNTNTAPELIFPYIPLTNPTEPSPPLSSAPSSTTSNSSCSYTLDPHPLDTQDYRTDPQSQSQSHHRPSTSKRLMTLSNDCSDIYSYTSSEKKTRPEDPCSATLMSGLSYTRVRHSDNPPPPPPPTAAATATANMFSCGLIPEHLQEYHHRGVVGNMHHRSTISSLGNQGAY